MSYADTLREELATDSLEDRVQTVLLSTGVVAFGVALGVKWAAVDTINAFGGWQALYDPAMPRLAPLYNHHMKLALAVAAVTLLAATVLDARE